jgi:hypothetical protein
MIFIERIPITVSGLRRKPFKPFEAHLPLLWSCKLPAQFQQSPYPEKERARFAFLRTDIMVFRCYSLLRNLRLQKK